MKRIFIFSPPRHRGDLLVRILNASGVPCAGESHDFLKRLRRLHGYRSALLRDHPGDFPAEGDGGEMQRYLNHSSAGGWDTAILAMMDAVCEPALGVAAVGLRDIFSLTGDWEVDADFLSWIQFLDPSALLIFLTRNEAEVEISAEMSYPLWVPSYGKCAGSVMRRIRAVWDVMSRYHALNPESTLMLDSSELLDFEKLALRLPEVPQAGWQQEISRKIGSRGDENFIAEKRRREGVKHQGMDRLPLEVSEPTGESVEVHTLRYGGQLWLRDCAASLENWCERTGAELKVTSSWDHSYPASKFCEIDMLKTFLAGEAERMIYVDGDVFIHPSAPMLPADWSGVLAMPDQFGRWVSGWRDWCETHFGEKPGRWTYRNAGVWACDREGARRILDEVGTHLVKGMMEQHQFNLWLYRAAAKGLAVGELDGKWNRFLVDQRPAWFYHLAGKDKGKQLSNLRERGVLPERPEKFDLLPEPEIPRAIVYPWLSTKAAWQELKYSLRSVERFFTDTDCPIFILGDKRPDWLQSTGRVVFLEAADYKKALAIGLQLAEETLWMNDDIYLRKECGWEDFREGLEMGDDLFPRVREMRKCSNSWKRGKARVALTARHYGAEEIMNFSSHTPYRFERSRVLEVLEKFGIWHKMPIETAYWNFHQDLPRKQLGDAKDTLVLNHSDRTLTDQLKSEIAAAYPDSAVWEF